MQRHHPAVIKKINFLQSRTWPVGPKKKRVVDLFPSLLMWVGNQHSGHREWCGRYALSGPIREALLALDVRSRSWVVEWGCVVIWHV
jgi:hypothetical protein